MRCAACDKRLSNREATRKFASGVFVDLCDKCLGTIQEDVLVEDDSMKEFDEEDGE